MNKVLSIFKRVPVGLLILFFLSFSKSEAQINIVEAFPGLSFSHPVDIQVPNDNSNRMFVVTQSGVVNVFNYTSGPTSSSEFLNITSNVLFNGEQGLLGLAFHPNFKSNKFFYVYYSRSDPRRSVISRFKVSDTDPDKANPGSELIIMEVSQPYSNHNGGQLAFGPDGYLYISLGDGGSGGDPQNNAQNRSILLGSILRIDINNIQNGKNYAIPSDNPYKNNIEGYREEIFAYGLRNSWRFSFDSGGNLWAGDVGQDKYEEIDIIKKGGNYGWNIMEGLHCFSPSSNCDTTGLIQPLWEYGHNSSGGFSITGGHVYEGNAVPELSNKYIYGDYVSGSIWSFDLTTGNKLISSTNYNISTFGTDAGKELYFADYTSGRIFTFKGDNINSVEEAIPDSFNLYKNYPNPFNPFTEITFSLRDPGFTTLEIFDLLGNKIKTITQTHLGTGNYKYSWNAENSSSGIYLYKLTSGGKSKSKKMVLLK